MFLLTDIKTGAFWAWIAIDWDTFFLGKAGFVLVMESRLLFSDLAEVQYEHIQKQKGKKRTN